MNKKDLTSQALSFCPIIPPKDEPEILTYDEEGRMWVHIRADRAEQVSLRIYEKEYPFSRGEDGIWHLMCPVREGIVYVQLLIDCMEVLTPYLPICYGYSRPYNCVMVEEKNDFYALKNVPHGTVRREYYFASCIEEWESCIVYTPPGYDENPERRYPVLYLQHGPGENEIGWTTSGKVNFILDNLIADSKAVPFIIVMCNGMVQKCTEEGKRVVDYTLFPELLIRDVIPWIEKRFRIQTDKKYRAMAGLSMGSIHTAVMAFTHPEYFEYVGIFSGFLHDFIQGDGQMDMIQREASQNLHLKVLDNAEKFNKNFSIFFRCIGKSDPFIDQFMLDDKLLEEKEIRCIRKVYDGTHDWNVWRKCIWDFAQMIFKSDNMRL